VQDTLLQLSILGVLTGVSVAVVQYLFTNHQTHLKDFIASLKNIEFDKDNQYDLELENQWESAINGCKKHTYILNPNHSILLGLIIIVFLVFTYLSILGNIFDFIFIKKMLFGTGAILLLWLLSNLILLYQIFKKETTIKSELDEIDKQHQLVDKVLNKKN
jgi:hypothetical protein